MKLACASRLAKGKCFGEQLAYLERFGFEGIEVLLPESEATPERLAYMENVLDQSPVAVCCLIVPSAAFVRILDSKEAKRVKLANTKKALEIGARLGGVVMVTPEYQPQSPLPLWDRPKPLSSTERELFFSFLSEVAESAEKMSVTAGLEPINRYETHYYHTLADVMAVCDRVGSERLKIIADFFHMNIEEKDIAASIEGAAGYMGHVQLGDSNRELPGQGHTDFGAGFAALKKIDYDGYLSLECRIPRDPERELPECVRFLRQCLKES